ncbi:hypothetical protein H8356DRAFT_1431773 [Neocallimastix lanati (nom. inval.)]|nr:hypothetical protein H8356DRAFT_1431773 [Neocallimastix sp. JGI-2020a]
MEYYRILCYAGILKYLYISGLFLIVSIEELNTSLYIIKESSGHRLESMYGTWWSVRHRCSHLPISKETPYRSTLRDPRGKAEPTIEELDTVNPLRQGLQNKLDNYYKCL